VQLDFHIYYTIFLHAEMACSPADNADKRQFGQMDLLKQMTPIALRMRKGFAKKLFT
jgi:hypothetical protein